MAPNSSDRPIVVIEGTGREGGQLKRLSTIYGNKTAVFFLLEAESLYRNSTDFIRDR